MQILRDHNDMRAKHRETTGRERQQLFEYIVTTITTKTLHVHPYNIYTKIYKKQSHNDSRKDKKSTLLYANILSEYANFTILHI